MKIYILKSRIFILLLLVIPLISVAQEVGEVGSETNEEIVLSRKEIRKARPTYYDIGWGFNFSVFRDFATSPLFYSGIRSFSSVSRIKSDENRESSFGFQFSSGTHFSVSEENSASSKVSALFLNYGRLHQIPRLSSEKWNFKAGGALDFTTNLRINESFQNNGAGYESFMTFFASAKVTRDISRTEAKIKRLWFLKFKLKPKERELAFRFNLGLMNNTLRNGFAYNGQSAVVNDPKLFDGYVFKTFSGFRASSVLDYTVFLKNNNGLKISYIWDAYKTGGDLDKFEMSNHVLRFSFLFRKK